MRLRPETIWIRADTMNKKQLLVVRCGIGLIAIMGIFPPWVYTVDARSIHSRKPAGYQFIFDPPHPESTAPAYGVRVDTSRLLIQWTVVTVLTAGILLLGKNSTNGGKNRESGHP